MATNSEISIKMACNQAPFFLISYVLMYFAGIVINKLKLNYNVVLNNLSLCALGNHWDCIHYICNPGRRQSL